MPLQASVFPVTLLLLITVSSSEVAAQDGEDDVTRIGGKMTRAVVAVDLTGSRVRDAEDLKKIVPRLKELPYLQDISLSHFIDDAALKELKPLTQLKSLHLLACNVTDTGLKHLLALKELQTLQLTRTKITDEGLKDVARLKELRHLDISITAVTDVGLKELGGLNRLTMLDISNNEAITDDGVQELVNLEGLKTLWIYGTSLTDEGLQKLVALKGLQELRAERTKVTKSGVEEFKRKLPDCKITWLFR